MPYSSRIGVYPGTFDPITFGHMDIVKRALKVVDKLIIAVADDIPKTPIFSLKERTAMAETAIKGLNVEVLPFKGLLMEFAHRHEAQIIVRGLRAVSDFEYEFQMAAINHQMRPDIQTIFLPASEHTHFISSRFVKEIARLGGDVSKLASKEVGEKLKAHYAKAKSKNAAS